ncbi:MAG: putative permease [Deltaproteobacteria bacterium]|nr:putative permease [Deltaproteobacteria bacterium]
MALGFGVGAYGTLIGAGGGFVLMPLLLILYPKESPEILTSISLAVVFFNALSGSEAYGLMRRIDYRSGLMFAAATVPGAVVGAMNTSHVPSPTFAIRIEKSQNMLQASWGLEGGSSMFQFSVISYTFRFMWLRLLPILFLPLWRSPVRSFIFSRGPSPMGCTEPLLWQLALLWERNLGPIFHKVFAGLGLFAALLSPYC